MQRVVPTVFFHSPEEFRERLHHVSNLGNELHIDFMDGSFVPGTSPGPEALPELREYGKRFRAHLMVRHPERYLDTLEAKGFSGVIFHIESCLNENHCHEIINAIEQRGLEPIPAINPGTPLEALEPYISRVGRVMLMGIDPGKEGQQLLPEVLERLSTLRSRYPQIIIEIDGGVNDESAAALVHAGASVLNSGSYLASADVPEEHVHLLEHVFEETPSLDTKLMLFANTLRQDIISMLRDAGSGHPGGALGMADIFAVLYTDVMMHDPQQPDWEDRDLLFLSNGHICPVLYAALAHTGYFPREELFTLRKIHTRLQGHPHNCSLPGVENSGGPLGQGISQALGAALALRMDKKLNTVFCICGDGELNEGQCWEAFLLAGKSKLENLVFIIDRNNIQIDGPTDEVMPLEPLRKKLESFGLHVIDLEGHDIPAIRKTLTEAKHADHGPIAIIAHTTPGKGVAFMEHDYRWHGKAPDEDEAKTALEELERSRAYLEGRS